ncbi:hypothetical protein D0863_09020 [Hortaea werneckii]|uniref:Atos-like conserved domain-containing protein n=1 Tax=Hortaea werneckii TaxID=91943 RepID=A0A3M7DMK0_HORWE|nr:hypothetical protein D0863_09020 [Hortaea werneckii]
MAIYNGFEERPRQSGDRMNDHRQEQKGNEESTRGHGGFNGRTSPTAVYNPYYTGRPRTPINGSKQSPIDRQEIIRKIKSRDSRPVSPELERTLSENGAKSSSPTRQSPAPLPAEQRPASSESQRNNQAIGLQIERPRSALHRGDFWEKEENKSRFGRFGDSTQDESHPPTLSTSPVAPWHPDFPAAIFRQSRPQRQRQPSPPEEPAQRPARSRAVSNASLASSFVYKAPTSPLVQSSRPDTPDPGTRQKSRSPDKSRRHTFSPESMLRLPPALDYPSSARHNHFRQPPTLRAEKTFPYQAHQPRRSLNSFQTLPQTPIPNTRKSSFSEAPLQHAPMVGSYEESILRGRMSTTPSKPLNFVAQIGVLGKGDCKSSLKCPPHVSIPFPAVFYSYGSHSKTFDQPSPYVGLVDIENNLPNAEPPPDKRRQRLNALSPEGSRSSSRTREDGNAPDVQAQRRRHAKQKRRTGSPRAPPGGSYRIPQQGQVQVVIKNPNKTAVKLFLIPYDLSDMEPGQKTFIRQRSYSAGPIIDMPLSSRKNYGTDRPEASLNGSEDPNERPMLRYLIHLHMCCTGKGRFWLYRSVRVVFANRVPDGKEKLRNEIQVPEPKYSAYKPNAGGSSVSSTPKMEARRESSGLDPVTPEAGLNSGQPRERRWMARSLPAGDYGGDYAMPMQPLPYFSNPLSPLESRPASRQTSEGMELDSEHSHEPFSPLSKRAGEHTPHSSFPRLDDPFNFERDRSRERRPEPRGESLLSSRLKEFALQGQQGGPEDA